MMINEEEHIEEEIEGIVGNASPPPKKLNSSKHPTTQDSSSEARSHVENDIPQMD